MKAWICLGSNLDKPMQQLEKAVNYLQEKCYVTILRQGKAFMTKPFGYKNQPDFANQLLEIETLLTPSELLIFLKNAELELGRKPTFKWGPRTIDMDIVFYGDEIINSEDLTIPHSGAADREYLLLLLNEVIPDYVHPVLKQSISSIYKNL
jgi:dihydroneopterin aldolase / 2-amino-4-hydroxy-6-hydroxymethyldihydropteridine diphosphokinase